MVRRIGRVRCSRRIMRWVSKWRIAICANTCLTKFSSSKMKALVKSKREPGLWLEDIPEPKIGINDVLIKVRRAGICGTDLHIYNWDEWAQKTIPIPMVIGHEFVGEIVEPA